MDDCKLVEFNCKTAMQGAMLLPWRVISWEYRNQ